MADTAKKEKKQKKKPTRPYRVIKKFVGLFYKKRTFVGVENLPSEPSLIVGNHAQAHGPLTCEMYFPTKKQLWCIGQMMHVKEVPSYAYQDFWSHKPKFWRWWYKLLSYLIAPLSAYIFTHSDSIGVYKDHRLLSTFRETERALSRGENVIVFPECSDPHNDVVNAFQDKFIDVARFYYKKHKKALSFVPMYNAPALRTVLFGEPIAFRPEADIEEERARICSELQRQITELAQSLPRHRVVPYANVAKKLYPYSKA